MDDISFGYKQSTVNIALKMDDYYVWDGSVIKAEGQYWMFASRWPYHMGFGWNWCFHSQIALFKSEKPEGPYQFVKVVLERRGPEYFDGMNTHNPCIKYYKGKYYLYYFGCTFKCPLPKHMDDINMDMINEAWNNKRIGLAISDKIDGEYVRRDTPLLDIRPEPYWDNALTTNPTVAIKPNGETYMIYKSKKGFNNVSDGNPLQLGITKANNPAGPFTRLIDTPLFSGSTFNVEDPYLWYDEKRNKYCALIKDNNGKTTGLYGNLFYAESDDCIDWKIGKNPTAISRDVVWPDGHTCLQPNLERPWILRDENGDPEYLFCASGDGPNPYQFEGPTYVLCIKLEKK